MSYEPCYDQNLKTFLLKNLNYRGEIMQILQQIARLIELFAIDICYADSAKVLHYVCKVSKLRKTELIDCLIDKHGNLLSLKNVRNL